MTPPPTIIGGIVDSRWVRQAWRRRLIFAIATLLFMVLSVWPRHYTAEAELMPQDTGNGLSAALSQQGAGGMLSLGSLIGNKQPIEADLTIARSHAVREKVIADLHLLGKRGFETMAKAEARLRHKLSIVAIRGSILQFIIQDPDPRVAQAIAAAASNEVQNRLAALSVEQAAQKKTVALNRLSDATTRLAQAQAALTHFQTEHKLAAPEQQLTAGVNLLAGLQAQLQAKDVEIAARRNFATTNNFELQAALAQREALARQVAAAIVANRRDGQLNVAGIASVNVEYMNLYRDERAMEILYNLYKKYLEEVTIDEMSANQSMITIEPAYVYPERQYNVPAVGMLVIVLLIAFVAEYYVAGRPNGRRQSVNVHA
jgi:uncharacterized protein involved in exopolysaccharide biosynthesis